MKAPRFKYYQAGYEEIPPMAIYALCVESSEGHSDVCAETLLERGFPIPLTPTYDTWRDLVRSKRKCGRCFQTLKNAADMDHHNQTNHLGANLYVPA